MTHIKKKKNFEKINFSLFVALGDIKKAWVGLKKMFSQPDLKVLKYLQYYFQ